MPFIKQKHDIDFVGKRGIAALVSGLMVIASILLFLIKGPNWGIDFTGGTEIHLRFHDPTDIGELRQAMLKLDLAPDAVQRIGAPEDNEFVVRIQDPTFGTGGIREDVEAALVQAFGDQWIAESTFDAQVGARMTIRYNGDAVPLTKIQHALASIKGASVQEALDDNTFYVKLPGLPSLIEKTIRQQLSDRDFEVLQVDSVGPKVGGELRRQGFISIMATLGLILVYVAFRFDLAFAPGAVIALFHDVSIVVGIYTLVGIEFNLPMIGALLTIIGYSLNDTIVIYDRIRENMNRYRRGDLEKLINDSVNETLSRTLATSFTTLVAMLAFLFLGGPVIEGFALAIILGVILGTYSTIYVASPMILIMQGARPYLEKMFAPLAASKAVADKKAGEAATATEARRRARRSRRAGPQD